MSAFISIYEPIKSMLLETMGVPKHLSGILQLERNGGQSSLKDNFSS